MAMTKVLGIVDRQLQTINTFIYKIILLYLFYFLQHSRKIGKKFQKNLSIIDSRSFISGYDFRKCKLWGFM